MTVMRLAQFNHLQQEIIKSMYKQVKGRCNDGIWRDFKADITVNGRPVNFECRFKLDDFFLSFAKKEMRDEDGQLILPDSGLQLPVL